MEGAKMDDFRRASDIENKLVSVGFVRYPGIAEYYVWMDFLFSDGIVKTTLN